MAEDRGLEPRSRFKATDGLANHSNTIMGVFRIAGTSWQDRTAVSAV